MITELISFILGAGLTWYLYRTFKKEDKDIITDDCLRYLKEKGYYVKLNVLADNRDMDAQRRLY